MNTFLENEHIRVGIKAMGAELFSLRDVRTGLEYMWKADPTFWGKTSPVLFPIVGTLRDNMFRYEGREYTQSRHGFAREMLFKLQSSSSTAAIFMLESSDMTSDRYPFPFILSIRYTIIDASLQVTYEVANTGDGTMFFSLGAHPAFAVPIGTGKRYEDYYLQFNKRETAPRWPIDAAGLIEPIGTPLLDNADRLDLRKDLFYKDAIVLKELRSTVVSLRHHTDPHGLDFHFEGFPYLGLWAAKDADFLCIEPWCGIADSVDHDHNLASKEGIQRLAGGGTWTRSWRVDLH